MNNIAKTLITSFSCLITIIISWAYISLALPAIKENTAYKQEELKIKKNKQRLKELKTLYRIAEIQKILYDKYYDDKMTQYHQEAEKIREYQQSILDEKAKQLWLITE